MWCIEKHVVLYDMYWEKYYAQYIHEHSLCFNVDYMYANIQIMF